MSTTQQPQQKQGSPKGMTRMESRQVAHHLPGVARVRQQQAAAAARAKFLDPELSYEQSPRRLLRGKLEGEKIKKLTQS